MKIVTMKTLVAFVVILVVPMFVDSLNTNDAHLVYARNAQAYGGLDFDDSLPYVPRYRYPVSRYMGKRSDHGLYNKMMANGRFWDLPLPIMRNSDGGDDYYLIRRK